jgi:hypothetical protein
MLMRKSLHLAACCWNNCDGTSICLFMFMTTQKENTRTNFPISQGCYSLLYMLSLLKLCCSFPNYHPSVLSDKHINILFTVFSCQLFMPEHVCALKVFIYLQTLLAPMQASLYIWWSCPQTAAAESLFFMRNSITAHWLKSYFVNSQFVTVDCTNTSGMYALSLYLYGADTSFALIHFVTTFPTSIAL